MSKHPTGPLWLVWRRWNALNMSSCIVEDREQLLEEFRKKGEYDIIIMKYLLKGGLSELLY